MTFQTFEEFSECTTGSLPFESVKSTEEAIDEDIEFDEDAGNGGDLNHTVDWRTNGAVTPVKKQVKIRQAPPCCRGHRRSRLHLMYVIRWVVLTQKPHH